MPLPRAVLPAIDLTFEYPSTKKIGVSESMIILGGKLYYIHFLTSKVNWILVHVD